MKKKPITIQKPTLPGAAAALAFAEGANNTAHSEPIATPKDTMKPSSGQVPVGDVRLTANISQDRHMKLKMEAVKRKTTIGELIEQMIDQL